MTVLVYKKGDTADPANFRPITLESTNFKVFSSLYRNRMQAFMNDNSYMNTNIQKGFIGGVEGVMEHTELLDNIMKSAKRHQRSLVLALFDLRNAFGEVRHNLIRSSLTYHHFPESFVSLFNCIYSDFNIVVSCNKAVTDCVQVQRGVLQGDPCSPLLFNICFNSLIKVLDTPNYKKLGYIWGSKASQQTNWLQYADDAALISRDQQSAQGLTKLFEAWCVWAQMVIRTDKCSSFGMLKKEGNYIQILPKLSIISGDIPPTPIGGDFKYLGRIFSFEMKSETEKTAIVNKLENFLNITSNLKLKPQTKLKILHRFILSQFSFSLRVCNFSGTWISETLDSLCIRHIRNWIEAPISSCVEEWLVSPITMCGMGIPSIKHRFERLQLSKRNALKKSMNENIRDLWADTSIKNVRADSLLSCNSGAVAQRILAETQVEKASEHFIGLPYQGKSVKLVTENISANYIKIWHCVTENLPGFLFNFVRKGLQSQLPTKANLLRWGRSPSNLCPLCNAVQSNKHVLSNCSNPVVLNRYTERHNKILFILATWLQNQIDKSSSIFVDLPGFVQTSDLFNSIRPDLVLKKGKKLCAIELTICHETNLICSKSFKENKYKNIDRHKSEIIKDCSVSLSTCEVSVLGFLQFDSTSLNEFISHKIDNSLISDLARCVIQASFDIYAHRDSLL